MRFTVLILMALMTGVALAQQVQPPNQAPVQTSAQNTPDSVKVGSVWDFVVKGGPVMIPIGVCSLIALTIIVERLITLRRRQIVPPGFMAGLSKAYGADRDSERALDFCKSHPNPLSNILAEGIKKVGEPVAVIEKHVKSAGEQEVVRLRKYLRVLSVITSISPLLGLLGTITGMITAFQTVASSAEALGRTELLAKGIYEAMITTAAGLMVAIPVMIAYHALSAKVDLIVHEIDRLVVGFIETLTGTTAEPQAALRRGVIPSKRSHETEDGNDGRAAVALATASSA